MCTRALRGRGGAGQQGHTCVLPVNLHSRDEHVGGNQAGAPEKPSSAACPHRAPSGSSLIHREELENRSLALAAALAMWKERWEHNINEEWGASA